MKKKKKKEKLNDMLMTSELLPQIYRYVESLSKMVRIQSEATLSIVYKSLEAFTH